MASWCARLTTVVACASRACGAAALLLVAGTTAWAQDANDVPELASPETPRFTAGDEESRRDAERFMDPEAADFDAWEPLVPPPADRDEPTFEEAVEHGEAAKPDLRPFDWLRHWGFHHSSTEGPFLDRGLPMERTSWLNRPYHLDWFVGPLLSDGPVDGRVSQSNEIFGGLRLGWDFDYYWGLEWRIGWADPVLMSDTHDEELSGTYMVSDVDLVYYPWGDTKVRPYGLLGLGVTQIGSVRPDGSGQEATLLSMPMGAGVQFPQTNWLAWRLEILNNLAFGADGVDKMNNFTFTAGMEFRMGAQPNSYWPWRSSRTFW